MYDYNQNATNYGNVMVPGQQHVKGIQPLTQSQYEMLKAATNKIDWKVTELEMAQAICTHRDPSDGKSTLTEVEEGSGRYTCSICGKSFNLTYSNMEEINSHVEFLTDVLQTIKTMYLDAPESLAKNFMQIIPLLSKVPMLYKVANENINKYNSTNTQPSLANGYVGNSPISSFQMFNNAMAAPTNYGYYQQPNYQMNQQQGQPMNNPFGYYQQPNYQQQNQPVNNTQQAAPAMNIPSANPNQPQQNPNSVPVNQGDTVNQTKSFNV